jgi:AbrB family looped-hinge helix DNA binding protein
MKTKTKIDSAGRLVIPKELRNRYGLEIGSEVEIIPMPDGISIVQLRVERRVVKRGRVVAIDTGNKTAPIEIFDISTIRSAHFDKTDMQKK